MTICPECGSDQVVQLAGQPDPDRNMAINNLSKEGSDISLQISQSLQEVSKVNGSLYPCFLGIFLDRTDHCFVLPLRVTAQMVALAVALFPKPAPLQKIPPSSRPEAAPSSSGMLRATSPASPPTQTATVKTACSGATATPPQALHRPSSTLHRLGDRHHRVSSSDEADAGKRKRHSERALLSSRTAV